MTAMTKEKGIWKYQIGDSEIWDRGGEYDSKAEAVKAGRIEAKGYELTELYVGELSGLDAEWAVGFINTEDVLEPIIQNAYDEIGEAAESYLDSISTEHDKILEDRIRGVVKDWMNEFGYTPDFSIIQNIEKIKLED